MSIHVTRGDGANKDVAKVDGIASGMEYVFATVAMANNPDCWMYRFQVSFYPRSLHTISMLSCFCHCQLKKAPEGLLALVS